MLCLLTRLLLLLLLSAPAAHAVVVRGTVTDALGRPLPGARVQLINLSGGPRSAADTICGVDGRYELRTDLAGRFLLLTSPSLLTPQYAPQIGGAFYGGRTDLLTMNVALNASAITPQVSAQVTLMETPLRQLSDAPRQIAADQLLTEATVLQALRTQAGALIVQQGQLGTPALLYLRGAPVMKILMDDVSAEELGGGFNLATITSSGLAAISPTPAIELGADANPLYGVDAGSGVLSLHAPVASALHPVLIFTSDMGNLSTERNEAVVGVAHSRADALVSFARLNTDNDEPAARLHLVTEAANLGYRISGNTSLRLTLRNDVSAAPLPGPFGLYLLAPPTRLAYQNLSSGLTFETRSVAGWHNVLRYGLVRQRSQSFNFAPPVSGLPVTILGANGYSASGVATFLPAPARQDAVTNRDEYTYQTDYPVESFLRAFLTVRYQNERAADFSGVQGLSLVRQHLSVATQLQARIRHRIFVQASGFIDENPTDGLVGAPRLGLTYAAVRPGTRRLRGTTVHATAASGVSEPSALAVEFLPHAASPRSRTFDVSVDQTILPRRLDLRAAYFHGEYSHQVEVLGVLPSQLGSALAYRTQGFESLLQYRPARRFLLGGGYTYLAALVQHSDAASSSNPDLPGVAIGATTALVGGRPFHRPPNSGFVTAQFTGSAFSAGFSGAFAGHADDTTGLLLNPTLLLPNRNLAHPYTALDASLSYSVTRTVTVFTQFSNLANDRHIAPFGYLSTPFGVRVGVRIRLGRE